MNPEGSQTNISRTRCGVFDQIFLGSAFSYYEIQILLLSFNSIDQDGSGADPWKGYSRKQNRKRSAISTRKTLQCDFNTHKSDFYTQSANSTRKV
jgi:hypothetical protein